MFAAIDGYIFAFSSITVIVTIWMGFRSAKTSKTASDFFVAGRSVSVGWNASAISGEYLSAASFMGVAGMVMSSGYDALWYPVCYACGYLFLLLFIAGPLRRFGAYTIPDFAEGRFDSPLFRKIAVCFVLFIGFFYTMPQMKGAGVTLAYIFPGLPYWVGVVLVGAVITLNVALGGMKGITLVQAFQYWAKMFAISVPIFVLMAVYGHYGKQLEANGNVQHPASNIQLSTNSTSVVQTSNQTAPKTYLDSLPVSDRSLPLWDDPVNGVTFRDNDLEGYLHSRAAKTGTVVHTNSEVLPVIGVQDVALGVFLNHIQSNGIVPKTFVLPMHLSYQSLTFEVTPATVGNNWEAIAQVLRSNEIAAFEFSSNIMVLLPAAEEGKYARRLSYARNDGVWKLNPETYVWNFPTGAIAFPLCADSVSDLVNVCGTVLGAKAYCIDSRIAGNPIHFEMHGGNAQEVGQKLSAALDDAGVRAERSEAEGVTVVWLVPNLKLLEKVTLLYSDSQPPSLRKPLPEKAPADSTWLSPFGPLTTKAAKAANLSAEESKPYSLLYTYSLIIALVCGTAGLPHILVRFYTNPDGVAAKRTTMWVMILIGVFYVFPPVFGVMGRNLFPELYSGIGAKGTDKIVLELPRLLNEKYAPLGSILSGITCAGAFAAFMSTFSGLLVSMTGALAHDVYGRMLRPKSTPEQRMRMFKFAAVLLGGIAIVLGSFVEPLEINFMVGQAFAIAAASYFPLLFMSVWWRGMTMKGAAVGMLTGGLCALIGASLTNVSNLALDKGPMGKMFSGFAGMNDFWAHHPLLRILCEQPAIWTVPLAITLMIVVSKLTRKDVPSDVRMKMLVLHAPEKLGLKQEYIQEHQAGGH